MIKIALLDDYQRVARRFAPWEQLPAHAALEVFHDHLFEEDALVERLRDFDIVMPLRERTAFPRTVLERLPRLKLLASAGKRNRLIDMAAATELGIVVCGTSMELHEGRSVSEISRTTDRTTMEQTWALILAVVRHVVAEDRATRAGHWQTTVGWGLVGRTLGIMGLGLIGQQMAEVANLFRMNVIAWSQNLTPERAAECGATRVEKDELFRRSDVLTIHTNLSDRTRGIVGARELGLMKPTAYLVNTSRGPIVQEAALVEALRRGTIAGAGLDVYDVEPLPPRHPLLALDNVVLSPHMGYVTEDKYQTYYGRTLENILAYLKGEPIRVWNPEVLPRRRPLAAMPVTSP